MNALSHQALRFDGTSQLQLVGTRVPQANTQGEDTYAPALAFVGPKYALAWTRTIANTYTVVEGRDLSPTCSFCSQPWALQLQAQLQGSPRFATQWAGGATTDDPLLVCIDKDLNLPSRTGHLQLALFSAFGSGGPITAVGSACGNPGTAGTAGGPLAIGNSAFRLELIGAPAGAMAFAAIGLPGGELPCGACTFANPLVALPVMPQGGVFRFGFPIQCRPGLLGATLSTQWWVFTGSGAPCGLAPGWAATRRLHLTLGQ